MKKYTVAIAALSFISIISAFEDKPALGRVERAALIATKGVGTAGGLAAGFTTGLDAAIETNKYIEDQYLVSIPIFYGGLIGGAVGGYKGGKSLAVLALAKLHGVPYRVEALSQHYNINVSQYKPILEAAASQNPELLTQAINEVYTQRFGDDWQARMQKLFKKYRRLRRVLVKDSSFIRKGNLRDFVRMVELGAAMANLYFKTNPNKEYTMNSAIELYQELGLLN